MLRQSSEPTRACNAHKSVTLATGSSQARTAKARTDMPSCRAVKRARYRLTPVCAATVAQAMPVMEPSFRDKKESARFASAPTPMARPAVRRPRGPQKPAIWLPASPPQVMARVSAKAHCSGAET